MIEEDYKSNEKTDFAKLFDVLSSNYNVEVTAEEKELWRLLSCKISQLIPIDLYVFINKVLFLLCIITIQELPQ